MPANKQNHYYYDTTVTAYNGGKLNGLPSPEWVAMDRKPFELAMAGQTYVDALEQNRGARLANDVTEEQLFQLQQQPYYDTVEQAAADEDSYFYKSQPTGGHKNVGNVDGKPLLLPQTKRVPRTDAAGGILAALAQRGSTKPAPASNDPVAIELKALNELEQSIVGNRSLTPAERRTMALQIGERRKALQPAGGGVFTGSVPAPAPTSAPAPPPSPTPITATGSAGSDLVEVVSKGKSAKFTKADFDAYNSGDAQTRQALRQKYGLN